MSPWRQGYFPAETKVYQNPQAKLNKENPTIEYDKALKGSVLGLPAGDTELFQQLSDNCRFKRWLTYLVLAATYHLRATPMEEPLQVGT